VRAGPGVRASVASSSHRARRRGGRAGCGAEEETVGERREGENDTQGPPVIERKEDSARWACLVALLGRLVGRPAKPCGLDQQSGLLVGLRSAAQSGWGSVNGKVVVGPLKNFCGRVAAHVSS
jgi:hypothetical protein